MSDLFSALAQSWWRAIATLAGERRYLLVWALAALGFFTLYVALPVLLIPGNSVEFQLSLVTPESYALFAVFALLSGLLASLQVYSWRHRASSSLAAGASSGSSLLALFGAVVKGPLCASCIATIAGFVGLGLPAVVFLLQHRNEIALGALGLVLVSLHYSVKRMSSAQTCSECCAGGARN